MRISKMLIGCLAVVSGAAIVAAGCDKSEKAKPAAVDKGSEKAKAETPKKTDGKDEAKAKAKADPTVEDDTANKGESVNERAIGVAPVAPTTGAAPVVAAAGAAVSPGAVATAPPECGGKVGAKPGEDGCGFADGKGQPTAVIKEGAVGHYGAAFTVTAAPEAISTVLAKVEKTSDKMVKVSGKIAAVCQKKGCWFVVTDGKMKARIKMKDYAFTIPIDSKGKEAVVEGAVTVKVWNEAQAKHLEEDAGGDPKKVKGTRKEYLLTATAIDIKG